MKAIILQRVIPAYRVPVFRAITSSAGLDVKLVIGADLPESKARNAEDLSQVRHLRLQAQAIQLLGRVYTLHRGLLAAIRREHPDVIVCEAESHFLGYLTAILYKALFARHTRLVLWCFYALPGLHRERTPLHAAVKSLARRCFDGFISYSSFGKSHLVSTGIAQDRITVAVNVGDTQAFLERSRELALDKPAAKRTLGVEGCFVASYVGTLDEAKRPGLLVELGRRFRGEKFHFFLVGTGPAQAGLAARIEHEQLLNVTLAGRMTDQLPLYYRASDAILVPGRGGIVISEAMCFAVPVIVHQADGIEYDLVRNGETGTILPAGGADAFAAEIRRWAGDPQKVDEMGRRARHLIEERCNTQRMADAVIRAIEDAAHRGRPA